MRRAFWLGVGVAVGAGGARWSSRRLAEFSERAKAGELAGDVARAVESAALRVGRHMSVAVDAGRHEARQRRRELHRVFDPLQVADPTQRSR